MRLRAAFLGAVMVFCVGWAGVLALLLKRASVSVEPRVGAEQGQKASPPAGLLQAAQVAAATAQKGAAPLAGAAPAGKPAAARVRGLMVEHDDLSYQGTTRHLIRLTVPAGLMADQLRRCIDLALDEERMMHPQVDAVSAYLYEEQVYARYTGRATPLGAAVAFGIWAPGGEWQNPARSLSGLDNRAVYNLPHRPVAEAAPQAAPTPAPR